MGQRRVREDPASEVKSEGTNQQADSERSPGAIGFCL